MRIFLSPLLLRLSGVLLATTVCCMVGACAADNPGKPLAPDFPKDLPWLNVARPLSLDDLRGKVVVLDFWTYGCINCLHVAEDLKALEERFGDRLAVIGVHTPKFDNERSTEMLRRNILRYDVRHPVVQDEDYLLMRLYGARAWPTLAVIDPQGHYLGSVAGEGHGRLLETVISEQIEKHADHLDADPLPLALEQLAGGGLAGPGKVAAANGVVAISDTLHHRVVIAGNDGRVRGIFGSGEAGYRDGAAQSARFRSPQGLLVEGDRVYVADAGNHSIRLIDLDTGWVTTIAGTGAVGRSVTAVNSGDARATPMRSPWALARDGNLLFIAMAGSHQIWVLDLSKGGIATFAGTGREGLDDGDR
ncbi:MAG: thioredoxin-like domain-containing protein, partial [Pseudomonadota bacterium]